MEPCICCVKQFVESLCKELCETNQDKSIIVRTYIDALPKKLFSKKRDIADVVFAAENYKPLTKKEKAELLSACLNYIYNK